MAIDSDERFHAGFPMARCKLILLVTALLFSAGQATGGGSVFHDKAQGDFAMAVSPDLGDWNFAA